MSQAVPNAVLIHKITIKRQSRTLAAGTKQVVLSAETTIATGVKARIEPLNGRIQETILGRIPEATHRLFCNKTDLKVNDVVTNEATSDRFRVREVNNFWDHHFEVIMEAKQD